MVWPGQTEILTSIPNRNRYLFIFYVLFLFIFSLHLLINNIRFLNDEVSLKY